CLVHDPAQADQRRAERRKNGQTTQRLKSEAQSKVKLDLSDLSSRAAIRRVTGDLLQAALEGRIASGRVQHIVSLLNTAIRLADDALPAPAAPGAPTPLVIVERDFSQPVEKKPAQEPAAARTLHDCPYKDCDGRVPSGARICPVCSRPVSWK